MVLRHSRGYVISAHTWSLIALLSVVSLGAVSAPAPLTITSPVNGSKVVSGQSLAITVAVASGRYPQGVGIVGEDPLGFGQLRAVVGSTVSLALNVPEKTPPGSYEITAVAGDSNGALVTSAPITIVVEGASPPIALIVTPSPLTFGNVGDSVVLTVMGRYAGGALKEVIRSSQLIVHSGNPAVAIFRDEMIVATGTGHTYINFQYGSSTASIDVTVSAAGGKP
jgi:hypothetical protein